MDGRDGRGQLGNAVAVVANVDFTLLAAATTALVGLQLVVLLITYLGWERAGAPDCPRNCRPSTRHRIRQWFLLHTLGVRVAWVRHLTIVTGSLGLPLSRHVSRRLLWRTNGQHTHDSLPHPTGLLLVYHQTYYAWALMAIGLGSPQAHAATVAVALLEIIGDILFAIAFTLLFLGPVMQASSPFFGDGAMMAASGMLVVFVVAAALASLSWEMIHILDTHRKRNTET